MKNFKNFVKEENLKELKDFDEDCLAKESKQENVKEEKEETNENI